MKIVGEIIRFSALIVLYAVGVVIAVKMEKLRFGALLILCIVSVFIVLRIMLII